MLHDDHTADNSVARADRVESKINERAIEVLATTLEGAGSPEVRYHRREAFVSRLAEEHR